MEDNMDVIQHLLQIENEAAVLLEESQKQSDSLISEAKAKGEKLFQEKYSVLSQSIQESLSQQKEQVLKNHDEQLTLYKNSLENLKKDQNSFNSYLNSCFFSKAE